MVSPLPLLIPSRKLCCNCSEPGVNILLELRPRQNKRGGREAGRHEILPNRSKLLWQKLALWSQYYAAIWNQVKKYIKRNVEKVEWQGGISDYRPAQFSETRETLTGIPGVGAGLSGAAARPRFSDSPQTVLIFYRMSNLGTLKLDSIKVGTIFSAAAHSGVSIGGSH